MGETAKASVALLGVKGGPAIMPGSNMPTSTLLRLGGLTILVDTGLGVTRAICDQGVALTEIDLIVITHLHSDHYLELGPLVHTAWTAGLKAPIPVIGPAGLDDYWQGFLRSMAFDINLRIADEGRPALAELVRISEIREGKIFDCDGVAISALRNVHPPIDDSFALCFETADRKIVLSGDTTGFDGMIGFARGADLLVHEVLLEAGVDALCERLNYPDDRLKRHLLRSHTTAPEVGRIAQCAGVKRLAVNHFVPGADPALTDEDWTRALRQTWDGPLILGRDGLVVDL